MPTTTTPAEIEICPFCGEVGADGTGHEIYCPTLDIERRDAIRLLLLMEDGADADLWEFLDP